MKFGLLFFFFFTAMVAYADPISRSFSNWQINKAEISTRITVSEIEVQSLAGASDYRSSDEILLDEIQQHLFVNADNPCKTQAPQLLHSRPGYLQAEVKYRCEGAESITVNNNLFFDSISSHIHLARFRTSDGTELEKLFTSRQRQQKIAFSSEAVNSRQGVMRTLTAYIYLGFEHILAGVDHIAFLLTLIILCSRLRQLLFIVTGFTLGHSATLTLATLGLVSVNTTLVEALIGFTIAIVAAENIAVSTASGRQIGIYVVLLLLCILPASFFRGDTRLAVILGGLLIFSFCYFQLSHSKLVALRMRPWMTAVFGLIHGFGFASVLGEIGLPDGSLLAALFGFNLGVEIGQLVIVCCLAFVGLVLTRLLSSPWRHAGVDLMSSALCGLGVYWFVQRLFLFG